MSFLYVVFFGLTDLLLYSLLTNAIKLKKELLWLIVGIIVIVLVIHLSIFQYGPMPPQRFWTISKSFLILILFHFVSGFFARFVEKRFVEAASTNKRSVDTVLKIFNFILYKLIYVIMFIYQVMEVWVWSGRS